MNYAYWFANIPGLSNCAKISIHEKVGNAQDIYFLAKNRWKICNYWQKKYRRSGLRKRRTWRKRTLRCVNRGSRLCRWRMHLIQRGSAISQNPPYGLYVKGSSRRDRCDCRCENVLRIRADGCKGARENACGARRRCCERNGARHRCCGASREHLTWAESAAPS